MTNRFDNGQHVGELMSGYIDNELTQQDRQRVHLHCEQCPQCRAELAELESLRKAIGDASLSDVSKDVWRENMNDSTVKSTRGIGWLLFIGGLLVAVGFVIFEFIEEWNSMPVAARLIIIGLYGGLLLLFFSVLRQRLIERRTDKYKDVEI
jgi:hypothetical protein